MIRDLHVLRATLGLSNGRLASLLGVNIRTMQRYFTEETFVPEPTWRLLNLVVTNPAARAALEALAEEADASNRAKAQHAEIF